MVGVNGTNFMYNPYVSPMNNDFMAQTMFGNTDTIGQQNSLYSNGYMGQNQLQSDEFQKQGGNGLAGAGIGAVIGGGATAAATYFLATDPIKDGKVNQNLLEVLSKENYANAKAAKYKELFGKEMETILSANGIKDLEQYNAIKQLSEVPSVNDLPANIRKLLPANVQSSARAQQLMDQMKPAVEKIDTEKLMQRATKYADSHHSLQFNQTELSKFKQLEEKIGTLKKDATPAEIKKFITENAEQFGLKGTKVEIANQAEALVQTYGTQEALLKNYQNKSAAITKRINAINLNLDNQFKSYWEEGTKTFKKDTPEVLTKAFKKFKISKAGKFGAIAAAIGAGIGLLFGSNA